MITLLTMTLEPKTPKANKVKKSKCCRVGVDYECASPKVLGINEGKNDIHG